MAAGIMWFVCMPRGAMRLLSAATSFHDVKCVFGYQRPALRCAGLLRSTPRKLSANSCCHASAPQTQCYETISQSTATGCRCKQPPCSVAAVNCFHTLILQAILHKLGFQTLLRSTALCCRRYQPLCSAASQTALASRNHVPLLKTAAIFPPMQRHPFDRWMRCAYHRCFCAHTAAAAHAASACAAVSEISVLVEICP